MRLLVMLLVYVVCFVSPNLIHFISLSGALFNSTLGFILPVIIYNRYMKSKGKLSQLKQAANIAILVVGGAFSLMAVIESTLALLGVKQAAG
jgi:Na+/serine symporter